MQIVALGLNHKITSIPLRERLAFPVGDLGQSLEEIKKYVPEGAIPSTCHRIEMYAAAPEPCRAEADLKRFWAQQRGAPARGFEPYLYCLMGGKAVEYLFAVACGIDSAIIGSPQILGQVPPAIVDCPLLLELLVENAHAAGVLVPLTAAPDDLPRRPATGGVGVGLLFPRDAVYDYDSTAGAAFAVRLPL